MRGDAIVGAYALEEAEAPWQPRVSLWVLSLNVHMNYALVETLNLTHAKGYNEIPQLASST
jgi:hypothetical protein